MCIVTHVAQIITLYKIIHCVALHTLSGITQKVPTVKFLHRKVIFFCVHSGKIYTGQKKFKQAPPVVPVTNMRYARSDPNFKKTYPFGPACDAKKYFKKVQYRFFSSKMW